MGQHIREEEHVRAADLVAYQEAAIVSRTVLDKEAGSVTVFAFDEGQGLSEHTVPFDALAHILDGEAEIALSGKKVYLTAGEMVVMPANQPHALKAIKRFKMILTMIKA